MKIIKLKNTVIKKCVDIDESGKKLEEEGHFYKIGISSNENISINSGLFNKESIFFNTGLILNENNVE